MEKQKEAPSATSNQRTYVMLGYFVVFLVFGVLGTWVYFAKLDSAVIASGSVAIESDRKTIQHYEGGIVQEINVQETQVVKKGDLLLRLKPVKAQANKVVLADQFDAAQALQARLLAERSRHDSILFPSSLLARAGISQTAKNGMEDQRRQFIERRASLAGEKAILETRTEQLKRQIEGLVASRLSSKGQIKSLDSEYGKVGTLADRGYFPINRLHAMERELMKLRGQLGQTVADISRNEKLIGETRLQIIQVERRFAEQVVQQLRDVRIQLAELTEKLRIADDILERVEIRAPLSGIVHNLRVHTLGGVVRAGEPILDIVPSQAALNIRAQVSLLDINYVFAGQKAEVRFPGYRNRTAPSIIGRVKSVSADRLFDETVREYYYLAIIEVSEDEVPKDLWKTLTPGMPADFLISTGERTVFDYLLAPVLDPMRKALHESS